MLSLRCSCSKLSRADGETKAKGRASVKIVYQVWCIYEVIYTALYFGVYSFEHCCNSADEFVLQLQRLVSTASDVSTYQWSCLQAISNCVGMRYSTKDTSDFL
jgi:hypothetical protein